MVSCNLFPIFDVTTNKHTTPDPMNYATRTLTAAAALALFALGMAPEYVDALSFGDALRAMRYVGGSSNAAAILQASNEYREVIAPAVAALVVITLKK